MIKKIKKTPCVCVCACVRACDFRSIRSVLSGLEDRASGSPVSVTARPWGRIEVCQWRLRKTGPTWQEQTASFETPLEIIAQINPRHENGWEHSAGLQGHGPGASVCAAVFSPQFNKSNILI